MGTLGSRGRGAAPGTATWPAEESCPSDNAPKLPAEFARDLQKVAGTAFSPSQNADVP
jgi:hypothetical protein